MSTDLPEDQYLRARLMNPFTGRFWNADTYEGGTGEPQSLHKYNYTYNDPVNHLDPSGHSPTLAAMMCKMALAGSSVGGVLSAIDTYIDSDGNASWGDLGRSFVGGAAIGGAIGFVTPALLLPSTMAWGAPMLAGATGLFGGLGLADAWHQGDIKLGIFRALTLGIAARGFNRIDAARIATKIIQHRQALLPAAEAEAAQTPQERGNAFHRMVYAALRIWENTGKITAKTPAHGDVTTEPDLLAIRTGVADIKDQVNIAFDVQLQGEAAAARLLNTTFSLIISPRTQIISKPLQMAVRQSGGIIVEFNPDTGSFNSVKFSSSAPHQVQR